MATMIDEILWSTITPETFLRDYWQKKPLLIRQAFPDFQTADGLNHFLDANELAGLACEEGVESRIIVENGLAPDYTPWQVLNGPVKANVFEKLPETHWTLLVQDVEKHIPELADILDEFRFIPSWRMDDLMVSYATDGGSVGAHVDAYDVFLLQAQGQRRWQVAKQFNPAYKEDVELRILQEFLPEDERVLEPGDMLYLPPEVAHHGIAVGDCITWSIGFRAPSYADIVNDYSDHLLQQLDEQQRYADSDLTVAAHPAEISNDALAKIQQLQQQLFATTPETILHWWGGLVTSPKPWLQCDAPDKPYTEESLLKALAQTDQLLRDPRAIMAFYADGTTARLFVNGETTEVTADLVELIQMLTNRRVIPAGQLMSLRMPQTGMDLLLNLVNKGCYYLETIEE